MIMSSENQMRASLTLDIMASDLSMQLSLSKAA